MGHLILKGSSESALQGNRRIQPGLPMHSHDTHLQTLDPPVKAAWSSSRVCDASDKLLKGASESVLQANCLIQPSLPMHSNDTYFQTLNPPAQNSLV